ncbi:serologically defined colon cancer antigen 8 homolog [Nematostella vectensis]|uniref:serologically defined colon cancer antigen 8 homolog n=1 Tax=Nematostella vectensis TaxID=45351 RepID=UPI002077092B|nr:serologically defined colon cancer antigen 8 homolog [Nematostella vectensis]
MFESDDSPSGYKKVIRDRASESLGSLRITFNSPVKTPPSASNNRSRHEYNSAVSRLKVLLQQYNNSKLASDPSWLHDVTSRVQSQSSFLPDADELTELLNSQYVVIQHLENQVEFYKDALGTLRKRTELITQENQSLYEQLKTRTVNELVSEAQETHIERPASSQTPAMDSKSRKDKGHVRFDISEEESEEELPSPRIHDYYPPPHSNTGSYPPHPGEHPGDQYSLGSAGLMSSATGSDDQLFLSSKERQFVSQMQAEVDKIRELHEAKSRHLETLLYSTRDELEDYQRQVTQLQEKIRDQAGILEQGGKSVLCLKCGTQEAVLASSDATAKTISKITRERDELMDVLTKQKSSVSEVRKRELDAYTQVKKSCELVEQAQLEKAQAIIQVQQLKEELKKQGERHEQYARESCNRAGQELEKAKSRLVEDIDQLNKKLQSMSDAQAATENQLDRVTREKVAIATELEQAKAQIMSHSAEVAKMGEEMQKELNEATIKTTLAEQQVASLKTAVQQASRQREQERVRQQTESSELRRRLEEAESGWMESKEECIRLTERLDHATREAKISATAKKNLEKARAAELTAVNQQATQREQQLTTLLQETENRNMQARVELEQMLESQMNVVTRLKAECQRLTQQLNDLSIKSRKELRDSVTERDRIQTQLSSVKSKGKELEANLKKKDQLVENLNNKLKRSETDVKTNITQIYDLLVKQNSLLRDRQALTREVEYLRQQLLQSRTQDCVTPADTESNASTIDNQDA